MSQRVALMESSPRSCSVKALSPPRLRDMTDSLVSGDFRAICVREDCAMLHHPAPCAERVRLAHRRRTNDPFHRLISR